MSSATITTMFGRLGGSSARDAPPAASQARATTARLVIATAPPRGGPPSRRGGEPPAPPRPSLRPPRPTSDPTPRSEATRVPPDRRNSRSGGFGGDESGLAGPLESRAGWVQRHYGCVDPSRAA